MEAGNLEVAMTQGYFFCVCVWGGQSWFFLGPRWVSVAEQEPTLLRAGWAWEEALGVKKTRTKVPQLQKYLQPGKVPLRIRDGLEIMALRVMPKHLWQVQPPS